MAEVVAQPPRRPAGWAVYLAIFAVLAAAPWIASLTGQPFAVKVATRIVIFAIAVVALDLTLGFGGLVSLCTAGLFGLGGYVVGILAYHDFNGEALGLPGVAWSGSSELAITLPLAALVAGLAAALVGIVSLRTSGAYFIMITLAFNQMLYYAAIAAQKYGGEDGLQIMGSLTLFGADMSNRYRFYALALAMLALATLIVARVSRSRFGVLLRASAVNEQRVLAVGANPRAYQLVAFVVTGTLAGLAGGLLAAGQQFISPADMGWDRSGDFVVMAVLGGVATVWGPIVGVAAFVILELALSSFWQHWHLAFGLIVLAVVMGLRGGLASLAAAFKPRGGARHD